MSNFTAEKKNIFTAWWPIVFLVYIANFALHDDCEGGEFFLQLICLNYI